MRDAAGADALEQAGREWVRCGLSGGALAALDQAFHADDAPGARFLVETARPVLRELTMLVRIGMPNAAPVRVVYFNKDKTNNWALPWHQDRVVALQERVDVDGFSNWTRKDGVWHAEPPTEMLQGMVFARIHLDAATQENGCLQLALGTHRHGKIDAASAAAVAEGAPVEDCVAERGDVLIAKALILHRSRPSRTPAGRRAVRVDYCDAALPAPLAWAH